MILHFFYNPLLKQLNYCVAEVNYSKHLTRLPECSQTEILLLVWLRV